jgi:Fic family protein
MSSGSKFRAGAYVSQPAGYKAFIPSSLPPKPAIQLNNALLARLSDADRALAQLNAIGRFLPNIELFVLMYAKREAVLSSQIEGTQSSLSDVLKAEVQLEMGVVPDDVDQSLNYLAAMSHGAARLETLPMSLRLIKELHAILMQGVRGQEKSPGEFRVSQNWIGGTGPSSAIFVPPPIHEMTTALGEFEKYLHGNDAMPALVRIALVHAQFETIHPFLDGNGRVGRLLITFLLGHWGLLKSPLLYPSACLKANKDTYCNLLQGIRDRAAYEDWIDFFLWAVAVSAEDAFSRTERIHALIEEDRHRIIDEGGRAAGNLLQVFDYICKTAYINAAIATGVTDTTPAASIKHMSTLEQMGLLTEITGRSRGRIYAYSSYLELLREDLEQPSYQGRL